MSNPTLTNSPHTGESATRNSAEVSSALPKHILIGYWHNWDANPAAFLPLRDVPGHFDVINIAFATLSDSGKVVFAPHGNEAQFASNLVHLQNLGRKIVISIGGATGSIAIDSFAIQDTFSDSVIELVKQYGFDGIDINLEGKVVLDKGDLDFKNPTSTSIRHLTTAIREIRSNFGPDFILSLAPETINVQGGFCSYEHFSGSYLPIIHGLRDILTYLQVQHYNSGALAARDHNIHVPGTADFHVAMAEMLLQGFPIQGNPENIFPPLKPEQVVIGLAVCPDAVSDGYTAPLEIKKVLDHLAKDASIDRMGSLNCVSPRGVMTWSINWDAAQQYQFSRIIRSRLNAFP